MKTLEVKLPSTSKPMMSSGTVVATGGSLIAVSYWIVSFIVKKTLGVDLPFSIDEWTGAVALLLSAVGSAYALYKRFKKPIQVPIENTDAAKQVARATREGTPIAPELKS
jgi:hypothetical protein